MKKDFMALLENKTVMALEKREGDYDAKYNVFYYKSQDGWSVTDEFSGRLFFFGKKTKKECQDTLKNVIKVINEKRCGDDYLKCVINYQEMLEDAKEK